MAKEPDQTKWRGIRPTDPSEDIPTTTKKVLPAIGDLQAVKSQLYDNKSVANKDCTVFYYKAMTTVPAGEIWVVTNMWISNLTSMCDLHIQANLTGVAKDLKAGYSIPADLGLSWSGMMVLEEDACMAGAFEFGGLLDTVVLYIWGYKIGVY